MAYVDHAFYEKLYGTVESTTFERFLWEASKKVDRATTGVDGFRKLKDAFPQEEEDAGAVKRCICAIISIMVEIEKATTALNSARGVVERVDGTVQGKLVSSVSAGNESVSYSVGINANSGTLVDKVLADKAAQEKLYRDTIKEYLSGVADANGVNFLYMGQYSRR